MANYYYVKDDGTATGDAGRYTSQQTGSFATLGVSGYYASVELAIAATTSPVGGDFVNVSDLHNFTDTGSIDYTGLAASPFFIVSVDDTNVDAARTSGNLAAESTATSEADLTFTNHVFLSGFDLTVNDNFRTITGTTAVLHDSKLTLPGTSDRIDLSGDGATIELYNCALHFNSTSGEITINSGNVMRMVGGSVQTSSGGMNSLIGAGSAGVGGCHGEFKGVDLTAVTGTLISGVGANSLGDDNVNFIFDMCKLASGVAFTNEVFKSIYQRALFTRCTDSSTAAEHQYHLTAFGGDVDDDSTIRRADDPAFEDSGTTISYKIVTNSDASLGSPLWLDFPSNRWAAISAGATDTLRLHIASTSALTDKDIYVEVSYPDGTNKQTPNFICSAPTTVGGTIDLMAAGTTLTTDSGSDWRDGVGALAGHNEYYIDVDTSGDVGADTVPLVRVYVTKPSVTIQLASIYELN